MKQKLGILMCMLNYYNDVNITIMILRSQI